MVLGSDGIWDVFSSTELVGFVAPKLAESAAVRLRKTTRAATRP